MDPVKVALIVGTKAGGPPSGTTIAEWVAKARQESSFRETVVNKGGSPPKRHVGLWQIQETHAGLLAETSGKSADEYVEWLKNPEHNWRAAKALYGGGKWKAWNASGGKPVPSAADTKAVTDAQDVLSGIGEGNALGDAVDTAGDIISGTAKVFGSIPEALGAVVNFLQAAYEWVSDRRNIGRILLVGLGSVVTVGSLLVIAKPAISSTTSTVTGSG